MIPQRRTAQFCAAVALCVAGKRIIPPIIVRFMPVEKQKSACERVERRTLAATGSANVRRKTVTTDKYCATSG